MQVQRGDPFFQTATNQPTQDGPYPSRNGAALLHRRLEPRTIVRTGAPVRGNAIAVHTENDPRLDDNGNFHQY